MEPEQLWQVVLVVAVVGPAPAVADHVVAAAVEQWELPPSRWSGGALALGVLVLVGGPNVGRWRFEQQTRRQTCG
jgi:hypothetical protein